MFARAPERTMRRVQGVIFGGWCVLILSLFWDPLTPHLTVADALFSPFHVKPDGVMVQSHPVPNAPYAMGARIFWTMALPLLPIFLMVFGHESWRRICPLSFASQLPRRLGWSRKRFVVDRGAGTLRRAVPVLSQNGWLQRNAWYVQAGLLFAGLCARILFLNSDRMALGVFFVVVIACAASVGYFWGGKTWCNYFCPVNVVQKIYTEPRGILESTPHLARSTVSQSMCRTIADESACVACTRNCGDIDLERGYWESLSEIPRRNVYYAFIGLVVGFYTYYYVYAGSWDYYFSGIWTHEAGALDALLQPGFFHGGLILPVPKLIAVPLFLAACALCTWGLGWMLERTYRKIRNNFKPCSESEILNHCLSVSAFLSINTFYLFAGRPNVQLMPSYVSKLLDTFIIVLTSLWLWQATHRSAHQYKRESLAASLAGYLSRLKLDVAQHFEGRSIQQLRPDEIYVLAKVMPELSGEKRLASYREILSNALLQKNSDLNALPRVLNGIKGYLDITDLEHEKILEDLGIPSTNTLEPGVDILTEDRAALRRYEDILSGAVLTQIEAGRLLDEVLFDPQIVGALESLDHDARSVKVGRDLLLTALLAPAGALATRTQNLLRELRDLVVARLAVLRLVRRSEAEQPLLRLLQEGLEARIEANTNKILFHLRALGASDAATRAAADLVLLVGETAVDVLNLPTGDAGRAFADDLPLQILEVLRGIEPQTRPSGGGGQFRYGAVMSAALDATAALSAVVRGSDQLLAAVALALLTKSDPDAALRLAAELGPIPARERHWLFAEVLKGLLKTDADAVVGPANHLAEGAYEVVAAHPVDVLLWIAEAPAFRRAELPTLAHLARTAETRRYSAGSHVWSAADDTDEVFVLRDGDVELQSSPGGSILGRSIRYDVLAYRSLRLSHPGSVAVVTSRHAQLISLRPGELLSRRFAFSLDHSAAAVPPSAIIPG